MSTFLGRGSVEFFPDRRISSWMCPVSMSIAHAFGQFGKHWLATGAACIYNTSFAGQQSAVKIVSCRPLQCLATAEHLPCARLLQGPPSRWWCRESTYQTKCWKRSCWTATATNKAIYRTRNLFCSCPLCSTLPYYKVLLLLLLLLLLLCATKWCSGHYYGLQGTKKFYYVLPSTTRYYRQYFDNHHIHYSYIRKCMYIIYYNYIIYMFPCRVSAAPVVSFLCRTRYWY